MPKDETPQEIAEYFARFTARRQRSDRPCARCGKIMRNALTKRRYCSDACSQADYRDRRAARLKGVGQAFERPFDQSEATSHG